MKVTLGFVFSHGFPVPAAFCESSLMMLQVAMSGKGNEILPEHLAIDNMGKVFSHAFPIDTARNEIVRLFLDHDNADYLLFLDADMTHPPDLPHRLVRHQKDIVTARYVMRRPPFFTVAMRKVGDGPNDYQAIEKVERKIAGLMPIDAGGAGALLLSRRLLQDIREKVGDDWFRYQNGPSGLRTVSEDMWCYEQARACGYQPWLDADTDCKHIAQFEVDSSFHTPYQDAYRREVAIV